LPVLRAVNVRVPLVPRIVIASAVLAVLVASAFAVLVLALSDLRTTTSQANRSKDMTAAALVLEQNMLQLEAGLRGFVNTGDGRFLTAFNDARKGLPDARAALEESAAGDEQREQRARYLGNLAHDYVSDYAYPLVQIAKLSPSVARSSLAVKEGRRRLDAIRQQVNGILTKENDVSAARVTSATRQANRAIILGLAALAVCVVLVLLFGVELARAVATPVRRTSEAAKDVAAGNLSVRVPQGGPAEVNDLAVAFNEMAASLQRSKSELEAQNQQLRESERLRLELISIIAHEVRTPLACVLGYTSLLQTRPVDDETRQRSLAIIADETRRLGSLVDELVDVKRIEEGRLQLDEEEFDLADVLHEQVRSFSGQSDRHSVHLDPRITSLRVHADRDRIAQVIANLLSNAIKYSPAGGPVEVSVSRRRRMARVSVRDRGMGIPDEYRGRIFTKFFRGGARGRGIGGMGLGLAVSRDIIEAHGGRMGFDSVVGQGSTFWFELPVQNEA
jgi:signal transduction histidine kinase